MRGRQRLGAVDWTDSNIRQRAQRAGPISAGVVAGMGLLIGTASGIGGAVGAGIGGFVGALLGYAYAGLRASAIQSRSAESG